MPSWLAPLLGRHDRTMASIELARCFLVASPSQRQTVAEGFPFGATWHYPDPARLACSEGERVAVRDRIVASLILDYLVGAFDSQEQQIALSASYRACELSGLAPEAVFESVAAALPPEAAERLRAFLQRAPAERVPAAFGLVEHLNEDEEVELRRSVQPATACADEPPAQQS